MNVFYRMELACRYYQRFWPEHVGKSNEVMAVGTILYRIPNAARSCNLHFLGE